MRRAITAGSGRAWPPRWRGSSAANNVALLSTAVPHTVRGSWRRAATTTRLAWRSGCSCGEGAPLVLQPHRHHAGHHHHHHRQTHPRGADEGALGWLKRLWPSTRVAGKQQQQHSHTTDADAATKRGAAGAAFAGDEEGRQRWVEERRNEVLESRRLARAVTWAGLGANTALFLAKAAAAHFGGSEAMLADALHTLSDGASDAVTLWAIYMSSIPHSATYPFGRGKFETLGTFLVACSLISSGAGIAYHALEGVIAGEHRSVPSELALYGAIGSIVVKELLYQATMVVARRSNSNLLKANAWHHRSDAISSIVALFGIAAAQVAQSPLWDPIAATVVSAMIVRMGWGMVRESVAELTDSAVGTEEDIENVRFLALQVRGVKECPSVRLRRMGTYSVADVNVVLDPTSTMHTEEALAIKDKLRSHIIYQMPQLREIVIEFDGSDRPAAVETQQAKDVYTTT